MFYIDQLCNPSFPIGLVKTEPGFIVRSVKTGLGRWTMLVAVISVDAFGFLRPEEKKVRLYTVRVYYNFKYMKNIVVNNILVLLLQLV